MSITLDDALQAAQDGASHHPIVEIKTSFLANIPFAGQYLTSETTNEQRPNSISHSSGRICLVYTFSSTHLKYVYTDIARIQFNFVSLSATNLGCAGKTLIEGSICEMTDNRIGLIFTCYDSTNFYLRQAILTEEGAVESTALIGTYIKTSYYDLKSPFVIALADTSYLLVSIIDSDSSTSRIYKRTSADFSSWSADVEISPGGGLSTNIKENVSLLQISTDDIFLWFDYYDGATYSNIYHCISSDNGATWSAAVKITGYTNAIASGTHPAAVQKQANQMHLLFNEKRGALHMDDDDDGWPVTGGSWISDLTLDIVGRKLYAVNMAAPFGVKILYCIIEIDIDSWEITRSWNDTSIPAFNAAYFAEDLRWSRYHGERYLFPIGIVVQANHVHLSILNANNNAITEYNFHDWVDYDITKNVDWTSWGAGSWYFGYAWVDFNSNRLYCLLYTYGSPVCVHVGYIDLFESISESELYTFNDVITESGDITTLEIWGITEGDFVVLPDQDLFVISYWATSSDWTGRLRIYTLSTGAVYKDYKITSYPDFPYRGLRTALYYNGKIYGPFGYESGYGEADKRGLCEIDLTTDVITYYRPTWDTLDDYLLLEMALTDDNKIIITTAGYGITIFDPSTGSWELINNASLPGLTEDGSDYFGPVKYDLSTGVIFAGIFSSTPSWRGIVALSRFGVLSRTQYKIGTYAASWSFGDAAALVSGQNDYDASPTLDSEGAMYVFWTTNQGLNELSIKWYVESSDFDLTPFLIADEEIKMIRGIEEGKPAQLSFSVSSGHLFDPHNQYSLLRIYLLKGCLLTFRLGEKISGSDYWVNQGSYVVTRVNISYERGQHPVMQVICEDSRTIWKEMKFSSSIYYGGTTPEATLSNLLTSKAALDAGDIDLPIFDDPALLYHQWVDTDLLNMLDQVCQRFGYFLRIDFDNKVSARKISDSNDIDHVYADTGKIIRFTPDDDFSDFTNRVVVIGEERDFVDITYGEEPVCTKNGTIGWWQGSERIRMPYSEDRSRVCVNPRIEWHTQYSGLCRFSGTISHAIELDPDGRYMDLKINAPNLAGIFITLIFLITAKCMIPDGVQVGLTGTGYTIPTGKISLGALLFAICDILGAITNWQCTVWAQPMGRARRSVQAAADDTDHQIQIGKTVESKIEEPMCYTVGHCQQVANNELMIARLQRSRVRFTKISHLQDEEGDTIQIPHPYTGDTLKIFITDLARRIKKPTSGDRDGYMLDDIEGWVL